MVRGTNMESDSPLSKGESASRRMGRAAKHKSRRGFRFGGVSYAEVALQETLHR